MKDYFSRVHVVMFDMVNRLSALEADHFANRSRIIQRNRQFGKSRLDNFIATIKSLLHYKLFWFWINTTKGFKLKSRVCPAKALFIYLIVNTHLNSQQ